MKRATTGQTRQDSRLEVYQCDSDQAVKFSPERLSV